MSAGRALDERWTLESAEPLDEALERSMNAGVLDERWSAE
jgi:hypothetical protein